MTIFNFYDYNVAFYKFKFKQLEAPPLLRLDQIDNDIRVATSPHRSKRRGGDPVLVGDDWDEQGSRADARKLHGGGRDDDIGSGSERGKRKCVPVLYSDVSCDGIGGGAVRAAAEREYGGGDGAVRSGDDVEGC